MCYFMPGQQGTYNCNHILNKQSYIDSQWGHFECYFNFSHQFFQATAYSNESFSSRKSFVKRQMEEGRNENSLYAPNTQIKVVQITFSQSIDNIQLDGSIYKNAIRSGCRINNVKLRRKRRRFPIPAIRNLFFLPLFNANTIFNVRKTNA